MPPSAGDQDEASGCTSLLDPLARTWIRQDGLTRLSCGSEPAWRQIKHRHEGEPWQMPHQGQRNRVQSGKDGHGRASTSLPNLASIMSPVSKGSWYLSSASALTGLPSMSTGNTCWRAPQMRVPHWPPQSVSGHRKIPVGGQTDPAGGQAILAGGQQDSRLADSAHTLRQARPCCRAASGARAAGGPALRIGLPPGVVDLHVSTPLAVPAQSVPWPSLQVTHSGYCARSDGWCPPRGISSCPLTMYGCGFERRTR
jgi:hypothetical protein